MAGRQSLSEITNSKKKKEAPFSQESEKQVK
jgi:hypothetical protein